MRLHVATTKALLTLVAWCTSCSSLTSSSAVTAVRSSSATGAVRWLSPTTRMLLIGRPPQAIPRCRSRAAASGLRGAVLLSCSYGSLAFYRLEVLLLHATRTAGLALFVERQDL